MRDETGERSLLAEVIRCARQSAALSRLAADNLDAATARLRERLAWTQHLLRVAELAAEEAQVAATKTEALVKILSGMEKLNGVAEPVSPDEPVEYEVTRAPGQK